ncbi:MAG TPA: hypothetical protein VGM92_03345, partial [Candidatus Kapabacteria bacterium]
MAFFLFLSLFFLTTYFSIRDSLLARSDGEVRAELEEIASHVKPGLLTAEISSLIAGHRRIGESVLLFDI